MIWQVPEPVPPSERPYKYRLVYVIEGKRIVGYGNERGKGDHKHLGDREEVSYFVSPQQLMADFMADEGEVLYVTVIAVGKRERGRAYSQANDRLG